MLYFEYILMFSLLDSGKLLERKTIISVIYYYED